MRKRTQIRRLADPHPGSGADDRCHLPGSEGMMTRARCRRLRATGRLVPCVEYVAGPPVPCAESGRLRKRARPGFAPSLRLCTETRLSGHSTAADWRDWANLTTELAEDIAGRLLAHDVADYLRFRAACKPWRECTDDPRVSGSDGLDDRRFRPRDWIALSHCASSSRRVLLNVTTGARGEVDLPELSTHHHLCSADGLLVLCHKVTSVVRLLNPLTGALTASFPAITDIRAWTLPPDADLDTLIAFDQAEPDARADMDALKIRVPDLSAVSGAGIDESTSPPTLLLGLRKNLQYIVCAKPGDPHWVSVGSGDQRFTECNNAGKLWFESMLSFAGRCYVTSPRGDIMAVDLRPRRSIRRRERGTLHFWPRLVHLHRDTVVDEVGHLAFAYLVRLQDRMLMVRMLYLHPSKEGITWSKSSFTGGTMPISWRGRPGRMQVFEVDVSETAPRLIPMSGGVGAGHAVIVGETRTVAVPTARFPKIASNAVYLNYYLASRRQFGAYLFDTATTMPPRELRRPDGDDRFFPCACHWELEDYLIIDVQTQPIWDDIMPFENIWG